MNILYCGDSNITDGLIMSILSILKQERGIIHFYVLTMDYTGPAPARQSARTIFTHKLPHGQSQTQHFRPVPTKAIKLLETEIKKVNPESTITLIDAKKYFAADPPTANLNSMFTPYCMLRLYADLIPELGGDASKNSAAPENSTSPVDKILYLDNDILAVRPFREFYNLGLENYDVAGSRDLYGKFFYSKNRLLKDYLNSGVLLINLQKIRADHTFQNCRAYCKNHRLLLPDQSALNKFCHKKILPRRFNEQQKLRPDTVFRHFTTNLQFFPYIKPQRAKPWDLAALHDQLNCYEFDALHAEYRKLKEKL